MTGIVIPDGGNIGSASDTDAISISSSGAVTFSQDINPNNFVGMIAPFAMATTPTGWLACDGSAVSKTTYSALFTALGANAWGTDTTDDFYLPDLEGAFLRGIGNGSINSRTKTGPTNVGDFQEDEFQAHSHQYYGFTGTASGGFDKFLASQNTYPLSSYAINFMGTGRIHGEIRSGGISGSQTPRSNNETFPYNAGVKYCIKY